MSTRLLSLSLVFDCPYVTKVVGALSWPVLERLEAECLLNFVASRGCMPWAPEEERKRVKEQWRREKRCAGLPLGESNIEGAIGGTRAEEKEQGGEGEYDGEDNYENEMFYFPRGAFPRLKCLIFNGYSEQDDPIGRVAYAMDHGYLPSGLRLELTGYAEALAEEATWKGEEEEEEEEGDEEGCKSESYLRNHREVHCSLPRRLRSQPTLSVDFQQQLLRGVSPRAILLWREVLSQARILCVQDGDEFTRWLDDSAAAMSTFRSEILDHGHIPLPRLRCLWLKTPAFPRSSLIAAASPAQKTMLCDRMRMVLEAVITSSPNLRGLDVVGTSYRMTELVLPAGCLPKLRALAIRTSMDIHSFLQLIRAPGDFLTVLSLDFGGLGAGGHLLTMAGLAFDQDDDGVMVNEAEDFLPPRLLRRLKVLRVHAGQTPLDGSTLHLDGLLDLVRLSPCLRTLWLRGSSFGAFDPFIIHFINLAHLAAATASGRDDNGLASSRYLPRHLRELHINPYYDLSEGGKLLLLAWLQKQEGVARQLYLPGWVEGREGQGNKDNWQEALLERVLGERGRKKVDRKGSKKTVVAWEDREGAFFGQVYDPIFLIE